MNAAKETGVGSGAVRLEELLRRFEMWEDSDEWLVERCREARGYVEFRDVILGKKSGLNGRREKVSEVAGAE